MLTSTMSLMGGALALLGVAGVIGMIARRQTRAPMLAPSRRITLTARAPTAPSGLETANIKDPAVLEALERARLVNALQVGDTADAARAYANLAGLAFARADARAAATLFERALSLESAIGELARSAGNSCNLGLVHLAQGDLKAAEMRLREGSALFARLGDSTRASYVVKLLEMFVPRSRLAA